MYILRKWTAKGVLTHVSVVINTSFVAVIKQWYVVVVNWVEPTKWQLNTLTKWFCQIWADILVNIGFLSLSVVNELKRSYKNVDNEAIAEITLTLIFAFVYVVIASL